MSGHFFKCPLQIVVIRGTNKVPWEDHLPQPPIRHCNGPKSDNLRAMKFSVFSILLLAGLTFVSGKDWPNFQGPNRTGVSPESGLSRLENPEVAWRVTMNPGFGGAAISGNDVFIIDRVPSQSDRLVCLDLSDGSEKWSFQNEYEGKLPFPGSRGVPFVTDKAVYFIGGFGHVYRINRETRKADWIVSIQDRYGSAPPKWGWAQSPVISGKTLVVPAMSSDAGLIGLNIENGDEIWRTEGFGDSHSTPTILSLHGVEQAVMVAVDRTDGQELGTTISVSLETGEVLWKTNVYFNKIPIPFPTKVTEELVFLTGGYGCGSCMIRVTEDWKVEKVFEMTQGTQIHPPFVIGDHIYFLANENDNHKGEKRATGGLTCMDFDGKILWNTGDEPFMGRGNMIYADGKLLIQDGEVGYLRVVEPSPEGYKELALFDAFGTKEKVDADIETQKQRNRPIIKIPDFKYWSPMALSNGHLIMRGQENLVCLKVN